MSPKTKLILAYILYGYINSLHFVESLKQAGHADPPNWCLNLIASLQEVGNDAATSTGAHGMNGLIELFVYICGIADYYANHLQWALLISISVYHLWKIHREVQELRRPKPGLILPMI